MMAGRCKRPLCFTYPRSTPDDTALEPLYALAEQFDVPLGIHIGLGPPGAAYTVAPRE